MLIFDIETNGLLKEVTVLHCMSVYDTEKEKMYRFDPYNVEDGVKMLGEYVMVAADFSIRPLCTIVPTSLGMGIVVDTGGFVMNNQMQLDIAVAW